MTKKLLITGSNRGIGLELAKKFKSEGYDIYSILRHSSAEIKGLSNRIIDNIDFSDPKNILNLVKQFEINDFDCCILNAGILRNELIEDIDLKISDQILEQFTVNSLAPLILASQCKDYMKDRSKLALITSRMGSIEDNGSGSRYGYRMSKAALNAAGKSLSIDLHSYGIAVGIFHPGYVRTEMTRLNGNIDPDKVATQLYERIQELNLNNSGQFIHANGEQLPW
ncbi:MAG: short-chain dehydrogenase [Rickettsiales bacterium]|nr:short-chain dehydrogenase [Rickettsiales bacterium]